MLSIIRFLTIGLFISSSLYGQINSKLPASDTFDLTDTANTAKRVSKLLQEAIQIDAAGVNDPVFRIQLGMALKPFAGESPAAVAAMYARYASQLTEDQLVALSLESYKAEMNRRYQAKNYQPSFSSWEMLNHIASYYYTANLYDSAFLYYNKALDEAKALQQPTTVCSAINNIGYFLMVKWGKNTEAGNYFVRADSLLSTNNHADSMLRGSITDNRAQLAVKANNWVQANELYTRNLQLYTQLQNTTKAFQANCGLLNVALLQHNMASAGKVLNVLETMLATAGQQIEPANMNEYFTLAQQYYSNIGNTGAALQVANRSGSYRDSLSKEEKKYLAGKLQAVARSQSFKSVYEETLYQHNLDITRSNARKSLLITVLGAVLAMSVLTFIMLQFRSRHKIQQGEIERRSIAQQLAEAKAEKEQLEREKIQTELIHSKKDLSDFAQYLNQQRDSYNDLVERLAVIKRKDSSGQAKDLYRLAVDTATKVQVQEKTTLIQDNIEKINTAFAQRLLDKYPNLTKGEAELCGFIRLNMTNKEIGLAKNVNPDSIKRDRNRLRNKLGLPPEADLVKLLGKL